MGDWWGVINKISPHLHSPVCSLWAQTREDKVSEYAASKSDLFHFKQSPHVQPADKTESPGLFCARIPGRELIKNSQISMSNVTNAKEKRCCTLSKWAQLLHGTFSMLCLKVCFDLGWYSVEIWSVTEEEDRVWCEDRRQETAHSESDAGRL